MVQNGDAWAYTEHVIDPEYFQLQEQAKSNQYGLWSISSGQAIAPWEWRKKREKIDLTFISSGFFSKAVFLW